MTDIYNAQIFPIFNLAEEDNKLQWWRSETT